MANKRRGHHEGGVWYEANQDRWVASVTTGPGKRKRVICKTKQEAIRVKNELLRKANEGMLPTSADRKIKDFLPEWLDEVKKDDLRISSYVKYKKLAKYILADIGEYTLQKITPYQIKTFYNKKLADGLATKTVNSIHGLLHVAFDSAVSWGYVNRNIVDVVDPPKIVSRKGVFITIEQAKILLEHVKAHRLEVFLTMEIVTGMRRGELLAMRWSAVDLNRRIAVVLATVDYIPHFGYVETEPKTKAGKRPISLPPFLVEMLKEHKDRQEAQRLKVGEKWENKDLVFPDLHGGYFNPRYLEKTFKKIIIESGLPEIHFHDLRHSAASILLSMGINIKVIQELLGHSNISITLDTYSHLLPTMQDEAVNLWDQLFKKDE
jgi:integrase